MKIAICVQHPSVYQQLYKGLNDPGKFRLHDFKGFSVGPPITDFKSLVDCITGRQADLVIFDEHVSFFQKAQVMSGQFEVEFLGFCGQVDPILHEVDMFASFFDKGLLEGGLNHVSLQEGRQPNEQKEVVVKIGERIVEKEIETLRYTNIPAKIIVIGSLWSGAGSTLYSMNLAKAIAERNIDVSYVEYPKIKPYLFDYLNIRELEIDLDIPYIDYAKMALQKPNESRVKGFRYEGVQWIVNDSRLPPISRWLPEDMSKLIYSLRETPIVIVDISDNWTEPTVKQFLHHVDHIYVCVEPDPVKIDWTSTVEETSGDVSVHLNEFQTLNLLQEVQKRGGIQYEYIEMKMNSNIKINTWRQCLEKQPVSSLDLIPYEDVMAYTWQSKLLYGHPRYHKAFEKSFHPLMESFLPEAYVEPDGMKKAGLIKKWIKRGYAQ